jgi:quinoprotein glucose dehydrogenase
MFAFSSNSLRLIRVTRCTKTEPVDATSLDHQGSAHRVRRLFRGVFFLSCFCVVLILTNGLPAQDSNPGDTHPSSQNRNTEISDTHSTWRAYGGAADGAQYSSLHQIDRSNVGKLKKVWSYQTGDDLPYAFNPLVVDDVIYVMARSNSIVALDATTGKEIWAHPIGAKTTLMTNRGIDYWESADRSERRLLFAADNQLQAIDARTGRTIVDFGNGGSTDLREGLGRDPKTLTLVQSFNPGRVFEDLLILGSATNEEYDSGPGDLRAYSVRTGKLVWSFHTIPHPGEPGYETWPKDAWKTAGGANDWSGLALDSKRGVVYVPTASPKYNFYGANRKGANLYGNCLLAINARTGKLLWHFQMIHHDIWDYDNAGTPMLATVRHDGQLVDVVAQATKVGFVWVFNRDTGKPLWPIEERAVPKSDMPGEETWPTQPFPTKPAPFARQRFTVDDLSPYLEPEEKELLRAQILKARNRGLFEPPSTEDTIEMPGNNGGANYGGSSVDPKHGYLYVVSKDLPAMLKLSLEDPVSKTGPPRLRARSLYQANCERCHLDDFKGAPPAIPSLVGLPARLTDNQIRTIVKSGKGLMPPFAKLTSEEIGLILGYLADPAAASAHPTANLIPASNSANAGSADPSAAHYKSGFGFMLAHSGLSVISPPWTTLTAYDLNSGEIAWQVPLGEVPELAARGITNTGSHFPKVNPVVTAGGLIFTGTRDHKVRALDSETGKVLWEAPVDAAVEGMPAVYEEAGREYVVFCAAARDSLHPQATPGHPESATRIHGAYVAFALQ